MSWQRGDGSRVTFELSGGSYVATGDVASRLERLADGSGVPAGWRTTTDVDDQIQLYDAAGRLLSIATRDGKARSLSYSDGNGGVLYNPASTVAPVSPLGFSAPSCAIAHPAITGGGSGAERAEGSARDAAVRDRRVRQASPFPVPLPQWAFRCSRSCAHRDRPRGRRVSYEYDGPSGGCVNGVGGGCNKSNLTKIAFPDGTARTYFYNEVAQINNGAACPFSPSLGAGLGNLPGHLTGIVDENGVRFASWTYSCMGLATSSEHAGGVNRYTASYPGDRIGASSSTVVTDPRGSARTYNFQTDAGPAAEHKPCRPDGAAVRRRPQQTFDANGNVASRTDWNGNRTNYVLRPHAGTSRPRAPRA